MKKFRTFIVDDEEMAIAALIQEIELFVNQIEIVGSATRISDAVELIQQSQPDLLLLDIKLSEGLSFDLLEQLSYNDFHLIFTTAYDKYAINAFKVNAFDYLLKPISGIELNTCLERLEKQSSTEKSDKLKIENGKLSVYSAGELIFIDLKEVTRFCAVGNYTQLHYADGSKILTPKTLKSIADKIEEHGFLRIHKSHLVNMSFVTAFKIKEMILILSDKSQVPVSHRKKTVLTDYFDNL